MKKSVVENGIRAFFIILFTTALLFFLIANVLLQKKSHVGQQIDVYENVHFQLNDEEAKIVNLEEFSFSIPEVGDTIVITKVLLNFAKMVFMCDIKGSNKITVTIQC